MHRSSPRWVRRSVLPGVVAVVCVVLAVVLLLWLPTAVTVDPDLAAGPQPGETTWWFLAAVVVVQSVLVGLVERRPAPLLVAVATVPLLLVLAPTAPAGLYTLTAIAVVAAVFLAVAAPSCPRLRGALLVAALSVALGQLLNEARGGVPGAGSGLVAAIAAGAAQAAVVVGLPLLVGSVVAARRAAESARAEQVAAVRREQDALLAAVVARQRTAMSRELHDIAAHHLSGIALLAAAMPGQVDSDPAAAKRSAHLVREQARSVLEDLRRLVGLLREEGDATRPVETLEALAALVRQRRQAGVDVDLVLTGPTAARADGVGPLAQLVVHRMVQESLANAAAHAPGARCTVTLDARDERALVTTVTNAAATAAGAAPGSGLGLVGMAERAQLVGGALACGPAPGGGWSVRLTLLVDGASAEEQGAPAPGAPSTRRLA